MRRGSPRLSFLGRGLLSQVQCRRIFAPFPILSLIRFQTKKTILACPPFKGFNTLVGFSVIHTPPSAQTCKSRNCVGVSSHPSCEVSDSRGKGALIKSRIYGCAACSKVWTAKELQRMNERSNVVSLVSLCPLGKQWLWKGRERKDTWVPRTFTTHKSSLRDIPAVQLKIKKKIKGISKPVVN